MKNTIRIAVLFLFLLPHTAFSADAEESKKDDSSPAASSDSNTQPENAASDLAIMSKNLVHEANTSAERAAQVVQVAGELRQVKAEHKTLTKEVASITSDSNASAPSDPEVLLRSKLTNADSKKELLEKKAAFLREKIDFQNLIHQKLHDYLKTVFSGEASFFVINEEIKELREKRRSRIIEEVLFSQTIERLSNEILVETKYLSAKDALLASTQASEKPYMLETLSLAEEHLQILKDLKSLFEERLDFSRSRLAGNNEFDKLVRLRRSEVFVSEIFSKKKYPYTAGEIAAVSFAGLFLGFFFLIRKRLFIFFLNSPAVKYGSLFVGICNVIFYLGIVSLACYGGLNIFGYRFSSQIVGLVYLNLAGGLAVLLAASFVMGHFFLRVIQTVTRSRQEEINHTSAVYSLLNVFFLAFMVTVIGSWLLLYWAIQREVTEFLVSILNYPVMKSAGVHITTLIMVRSGFVILFFFWLPRFINGFLKTYVYPKSSLQKNSQHAIQTVLRFVLIATGISLGIQLLGINLSAFAVFSGTLGLGIGLGLQDIIKNVVSGFVIFFERPIRIGDFVEVGSTPGQVKSIRTRSTIINTFDNISIVVPNSEFLSQRVVNWSLSDSVVRIESKVGVSYGSDVNLVKGVLLEIAKANKKIMPSPEPVVIFEDFADSALLFRLLFWVDVEDRLAVRSEVNFAINSQFNEKGIVIPFPQRDINLKSSDFLIPKTP